MWDVYLCNTMIQECFLHGRGRRSDATFTQVQLGWGSENLVQVQIAVRLRGNIVLAEGVKEKLSKDLFPGNPTYLHGNVLTVIC